MKSPTSSWLGRPLADAEDVHDLETRAAIGEFHGKLPRHEAESKAYEEYVKDKRLEACAHHLAGVKAAHGAGDMDQARRHGMMYDLHMKALDLNPHEGVPPEVTARLNAEGRDPIYRFKAHRGDVFALQDHEAAKSDEVKKSEDGVRLLKKVADDRPGLEVLRKADPELAKESCDYTAKSTKERCKNPRSRLVGNRYLCHWHSDPAAKSDHFDYNKKRCPTCDQPGGEHTPTCMG